MSVLSGLSFLRGFQATGTTSLAFKTCSKWSYGDTKPFLSNRMNELQQHYGLELMSGICIYFSGPKNANVMVLESLHGFKYRVPEIHLRHV